MKTFGMITTLILIATLVLSACTAPKPSQQFTFRTGIVSTPSVLPYIVIIERGLDKKYGIQLNETAYGSGNALVQDLAAGSLDIGVGVATVTIFSAVQSGLVSDRFVIGAAMSFCDSDHPYMGVLVGPSINNWQDLKGKQIAVPALTGINAAGIKTRLKAENITDFTLLEIPIPNMGLSVAGGNIAAAVFAEPYITQSLLRKDGKLLGWVVGGFPFEKMEVTTVVFSTALYRENPQAVKAFLRAYLDAVKWVYVNPKEAGSILGKKLNLSSDVTSRMIMPQWSLDGHNDPVSLENTQRVLIDVGLLNSPIPTSQLYDETLLNEVLKERHAK
jgi:ABC-type nitrate/sulfonate/bicarbonate transport system substrate-binding protein